MGACVCEHRSSLSPGAPRLAPKRLRGAGTALWIPTLWIPTESSDPAEPEEATRERPTACRGGPAPRRLGDGDGVSATRTPHLRSGVGPEPPHEPRPGRIPAGRGQSRLTPGLPLRPLPARPPRWPLPPPPGASPVAPIPLPSPPAPGARATAVPSPLQGRVRRARRTHPRAWAGGVLGSALRCRRLQLQLCSDAARRSPPPPPPQLAGGRHVTAEPPPGALPPLRSRGRGRGGGPHPASLPPPPTTGPGGGSSAPHFTGRETENPRRGGLAVGPAQGSPARLAGPGGDPAVQTVVPVPPSPREEGATSGASGIGADAEPTP
ncbi:basic proline-rich protein-like [Moschus berezovskii]|uniref:basic proline-rich protein-like n=1 Tax=Moschus berezovskii TaxID=68408 RepID=UPI00244389EC|nr:basic proline-rich protein-like [Moschus berezovskii]